MAKPAQPRFPRLRRIFRWCRIFIWLVLLAIVIAGIYLNTIGLPDFLKRPLLAKFRSEGVQVDFSRMRLRWYRGIVVDKATFTFLKHPLQPKFSSAETELKLDLRSLRNSHLKLNSLAIKQGNLIWPVSKTNQLALTLSNITAKVQFRPNEKIDLHHFEANFANTKISMAGSVTNASAMRGWKLFQPKKPKTGRKGGLERFAVALEQIHLTGSPELTLQFSGDAATPQSFQGKFHFTAPEAETPWGNETNLQLTAELGDFSNVAGKNFIRVKADSLETLWGSASNVDCVANLSFNSTNHEAFQTDLELFAKELRLKSGRAGSVQITARSSLSWTNLVPTGVTGKANLVDAEMELGKAASAEITFSAATNSSPKIADESWGAWRHAEPFLLDWEGHFSKIETPKLQIEKFSCAGTWSAPDLRISDLNAELYGGEVAAKGFLNVATREAGAKASSDFDVQKISPLLTPFGQRWIGKYSWEKSPKVNGELHVVLPAWTNQAVNWRKEVLPTLGLDGHVSVERGSYRAVTATAAKTDFTYSNMVWTLPHLRVDRPEGGADLNLVANDRTREYHWKIHSEIDPKAIRHLLTEQQQRVFDDFQFTNPPIIHAELIGRWNEMEKTSVDGEVVATNFSFRSNSIDKFTCLLQITNQALSVRKVRLDRADKFITAQKVKLDFLTKKIFFSDVYGSVDPYLVTRVIGRKVAANIAPYRFAEPPAVRLNGSLSITNVHDADMHFMVEGNQFQWRNFYANKISGRLDWVGETLLVTNVHASAYRDGSVEGWAYFDFEPRNGTDFRFDFVAADLDLQLFISGLTGKTNQLEGLLHGQFTLDSANTRDAKSWKGHGRANLRDGLIWDVPIFGIFSPVLNTLMPGAGNSRAREASGTYVVRDGIVYSDDLEIRSSGLRLQYRGGVDFEKRVDARVEAELLRDTWIIGPLVSLALTPISKIFEYQVSGTLSEPKSEPVYIPNILMMTLRPFHSLKGALTPEKEKTEPPLEPPPQPNP